MKKFLKIFLIVIASLFILLLLAPVFFKKPIENLVKKEINNSLNAKVNFSDFKLSFIRAFPNVYIALDSLTVVGTGDFEKDTLIAFKTFSVKVDIISAMKMKNIKVKSILLDSPHITALVLKNGKANWDIVKDTTTTPTATDTAASKPVDFGANLQKFEIKHAYIRYQDDTSKISANIQDFNFLLSGDFSAKTTDMKITTSVESMDVVMEGIKYLKKAKLSFVAQIGADLEKSIYTIKNNEIKLNELSLNLDGSLKMPSDTIMDVDMKFKTNKADFKTLLSLIPAIYMKDFASVQTSGKLQLSGYAKGIYGGKITPNAGINLKVENAMFKYPSLPKSVNNINVDVDVLYDGTNMDKTTVDVNKFHVEMAGNPFDISLHIKTPISDMALAGTFAGKLNFTSIADIIPLDSMTIKGLLTCNVNMAGKMSSITNQKYEEFKADGTLSLQNFEFVSPDFKQGVKIVKTDMIFSPKFVELTSFDARVGKSDFQMTGKLEKFIPYVFAHDTITGTLNFSSKLTDVNELMGPPTTTTATAPVDTTPLSVVEVPGNISFTLNAKIDQINYDKMKITNLAGIIVVRNSKAILKNLGMNLLDGNMIMNGEYNTQNIKKPSFAFNFNMKDIDIPSTYTAFNTVAKMAPAAKNCKGRISAQLDINSVLDEHMMPVYPTMQGSGKLMSNSVEISNSNAFNKIADVLKNDKYRKATFTNLNISFEIKDGRIYVKPFDTKIGNTKMNISGDQGIDQTINYVIKTAIPRSDLGGTANSLISALEANAASKGVNVKMGETVNINLGVTGTFSKPEVKLLSGDKTDSETPTVKDQAKAVVTQKVAEVKEDVKKKAKEQADKLIKDAESEAQKIRDAAKAAANASRSESNAGADKLIKEAGSNPIKKEVAKKTAEKLKKEGESKAQKIEQEGNSKADAVINKAKAEAAKLQ